MRTAAEVATEIAVTRSHIASLQATLADQCVEYADLRAADDDAPAVKGRPKSGAFAADELAVILTEASYDTSRLVARSRRVRQGLPDVHAAARAGRLDAVRVQIVDQVACHATEPSTISVLDAEAAEHGATKTPKQLKLWLQRLLWRLEPDAADHRFRVQHADRRVTIAQSVTGMGYVTAEVSAMDAAAIDQRLSTLAIGLGADDPRGHEQRRSDLLVASVLGTLHVDHHQGELLEVERVDPDTGELLGVDLVPVDAEGDVVESDVTVTERSHVPSRIGVVVPVTSLLSETDGPGELADRSASVTADSVWALAGILGTRFTALVTDEAGHVLDIVELGRFASQRLSQAVRIRAGTCSWPGCTVSAVAERCDLDHHEPVPRGPTTGSNLDPLCRHHHRAKTHVPGLTSRRVDQSVVWTMPDRTTYRCLDQPLPTGCAVQRWRFDELRA